MWRRIMPTGLGVKRDKRGTDKKKEKSINKWCHCKTFIGRWTENWNYFFSKDANFDGSFKLWFWYHRHDRMAADLLTAHYK